MLLHLVDDRGPQTCAMTLALLADTLAAGRDADAEQHVLLLGGQRLRDSARQLGVDRSATSCQSLGLPLQMPVLAPSALLRRLWRFRRARAIHAWSDTALSTAALFAPRIPRVVHLTQPPTPAAGRRLLRQMYHAGMDVHVPDETLADTLRRFGLPPGRVHHVQPPAPAVQSADVPDAAAPRARWGAASGPRGVSGGSVVAWMTDAPSRTDARDAALLLGLLCQALPEQERPTLLIHPATPRLWSAIDQLTPQGIAARLVQEPRLETPWQVLPAVDLAVLVGDATTLSRRWAQQAGVPVTSSEQASPARLAHLVMNEVNKG